MKENHDVPCPLCPAFFVWGPGKTVEDNAALACKDHVLAAHPDAMFECPRQCEAPMFAHAGKASFWRHDGTCWHCGSLSPDRFFAAIEEGRAVGPTDKTYKAYIDLPNEHEGRMSLRSSVAGPVYAGDGVTVRADVPTDLTDAELAAGRYERRLFAPEGATKRSKFYFQHFSTIDQMRFIDLLNARKVTIGSPGHFYVRPFFIAPAVPT